MALWSFEKAICRSLRDGHFFYAFFNYQRTTQVTSNASEPLSSNVCPMSLQKNKPSLRMPQTPGSSHMETSEEVVFYFFANF